MFGFPADSRKQASGWGLVQRDPPHSEANASSHLQRSEYHFPLSLFGIILSVSSNWHRKTVQMISNLSIQWPLSTLSLAWTNYQPCVDLPVSLCLITCGLAPCLTQHRSVEWMNRRYRLEETVYGIHPECKLSGWDPPIGRVHVTLSFPDGMRDFRGTGSEEEVTLRTQKRWQGEARSLLWADRELYGNSTKTSPLVLWEQFNSGTSPEAPIFSQQSWPENRRKMTI